MFLNTRYKSISVGPARGKVRVSTHPWLTRAMHIITIRNYAAGQYVPLI